MGILKKLVDGRLSLAVTFWIFYFVFRTVMNIGIIIGYVVALLGVITEPVLYSIITVIIGISNILKNKGVTFWPIVALIVCGFNWIFMMQSFFDGCYSYDVFLDTYAIALDALESVN